MKRIVLTALIGLIYLCACSRDDDITFADEEKFIAVDFTRDSSEKRFVVYNDDGTAYFSCKCAHGQGGKSTSKKPEFSNKIGSNCSCLGKFEIVGFYSKNGINYLKLKGLDKTNSNALVRGICIHNSKLVTIWKYIPFFNIPLSSASNGCFAIDNESMDKLIQLYKQKQLKYLFATNIEEI